MITVLRWVGLIDIVVVFDEIGATRPLQRSGLTCPERAPARFLKDGGHCGTLRRDVAAVPRESGCDFRE